MSMLNSLCNDNTKRLIPQLITHPIKLAVMHDVILDTAKFQLGISFFSFRKDTDLQLTIFGKSLFDAFDFITGQILLPFGGFLTCLFLGWYVPKRIVKDQFTNWGTLRGTLFGAYLFCVRFVCPICILLIFLHQFGII